MAGRGQRQIRGGDIRTACFMQGDVTAVVSRRQMDTLPFDSGGEEAMCLARVCKREPRVGEGFLDPDFEVFCKELLMQAE
ncbi:hypothetical protein RRF57_002813 [Xylaria bambusicola]|uniref:Uncharacterized protein n=1 Tax=Xylaria bambusicola TaxID=326684 RepID=A0AAN7Z4T0_9PEZI